MRKTIHSPEQETLVGLLKDFRERAGLTQTELATRLAKPQAFVSRYEAGQRRLDLPELGQVCAALQVSLVELVRRYEEAAAPSSRG